MAKFRLGILECGIAVSSDLLARGRRADTLDQRMGGFSFDGHRVIAAGGQDDSSVMSDRVAVSERCIASSLRVVGGRNHNLFWIGLSPVDALVL